MRQIGSKEKLNKNNNLNKMNNQLLRILILLTAIQINFACKKADEEHCNMVRVEIYSSRNYVLVDNVQVLTPALFYWKVGKKVELSALGSWDRDLVKISVFKELIKDTTFENFGQVKVVYEVQP
jgi:hypothetical protein